MPHNPTSITAWSTAQQFNSGEAATSTQYNQVVNNLSLLYAKPWMMAYLNTNLSSVATGTTLFSGSNTTTISNSPASLAGSITWTSGTGLFTVPLTGLYRITMFMTLGTQASPPAFYMACTTSGGASANNAVFSGPRTTASATAPQGMTSSFVWPFSATGTSGAYPTAMTFTTSSSTTITTINGSTAPSFANGTYVQIEYLGTSNGSI